MNSVNAKIGSAFDVENESSVLQKGIHGLVKWISMWQLEFTLVKLTSARQAQGDTGVG